MVADLMSAFVMVMRAHPKDADVSEAGDDLGVRA